MLKYLAFQRIGIVMVETLLLVYCALCAFAMRVGRSPFQTNDARHLFLGALTMALIYQLFLHLADVYDFDRTRTAPGFMARLGLSLCLASLFLTIMYYFSPGVISLRRLFPYSLIASSIFLIAWHILLRIYFGVRGPRSNVLILGTGRLAQDLAKEVTRHPELGIGVTGFLDDDPENRGLASKSLQIVGTQEDLPDVVSENKVDRIVVELANRRGRLPVKSLLTFKTRGIEIEDATSFYERITGKIAVQNLKPSWIIFNSGFSVSRSVMLAKRVMSIFVSLPLLILFSPIISLIMLLIKLDSEGPIFFRQERVGQGGHVFTLFKFRSMYKDAEQRTGPVWAQKNDARVTRVGRLLRRTRLDELPQLYNVLRGDMSLIGPRPERPHFVKELIPTIPYYNLRHAVKPGLTGWAQIKHEYTNSLDGSLEKLQYDLFYIKNMSILLDILIMLETIKTVVVRRGS